MFNVYGRVFVLAIVRRLGCSLRSNDDARSQDEYGSRHLRLAFFLLTAVHPPWAAFPSSRRPSSRASSVSRADRHQRPPVRRRRSGILLILALLYVMPRTIWGQRSTRSAIARTAAIVGIIRALQLLFAFGLAPRSPPPLRPHRPILSLAPDMGVLPTSMRS